MGLEYPEFTDNTYVGNWPLREMMIATTGAQRKHDKGSAKKKTAKKAGGGTAPAQGESGESQAEKNTEVEKETGTKPQPTKEKEDVNDADRGVDGDDSSENGDEPVFPGIHLWARLGPVLGNLLIGECGHRCWAFADSNLLFPDYEHFNLSEDWADYKDKEEAERWEEYDQAIQDFVNKLSEERRANGEEFSEGTLSRLLQERLGAGKDYEDVWRGWSVHPSGIFSLLNIFF